MQKLLLVFSFSLSFSALAATSLTQGLARPESVYIEGSTLYISNQSGPGTLKDGVGWIQKLDLKGRIVQEKWVEGLNAPKGMRSSAGKLYVADIDEIAIIDLETGSVEKVAVAGAKLLNDVTIDSQGDVLVSDTYASKIFKLNAQTHEVSELITLTDAPNGLLVVGEALYIAGYGSARADGTGVVDGTKGSLKQLQLKSGELTTLIPEIGRIDGMEMTENRQLLISVKQLEALYWVDLKTHKLVGALSGTTPMATLTDVADIAYDADSNTVFVPNTNMHNVQVIKLR